MDAFVEALVSKERNPLLPEEYDWYAPLLGDWDFDYYDGPKENRRHVKGEWLFRRALDGMAIEDLFICPSRATREENPQPDGEYGAAIRMFNPEKRCYDMTYVCETHTVSLEIRKEKECIACTVREDPTNKWVFSEITENTFHWRNVTVLGNGEWRTNADVYAKRRK